MADEADEADDRGALGRASARRDAANDRRDAARDRHADAVGRRQAEADRGTAGADRRNGAFERVDADSDRDSAQGDRDLQAAGRLHSARDRSDASADRAQAGIDLRHACIDVLTSVYTRSAGLLELQREIDRARRSGVPLALAFVDVDGLKAANDAGGHLAGDAALVRVADALKGRLRPYDLVIRYGGDEFVCVLADIQPQDAAVRVDGVNAGLAQGEPPLSVSIGMSHLRAADSAAELVERADRDLYRRRRAARGRPAQ